jgi:hypothetical protein
MREKTRRERELDPENIREWGVNLLRQVGDAKINIAKLNDIEYLQKLSAFQMSRIKKVTFGKEGQIVGVDLHDIVNVVEAAATIAGTREMVKEQAKMKKEEAEESGRKARSDKLTLVIGEPQKKKPEKPEKPEEPPADNSKSADDPMLSLLSNIK